MDLNQLKANVEQETAKQYFAKPKGKSVSATSFGAFLKYALASVIFAALCVGSYQLSRSIKAGTPESSRFAEEVLKMSATREPHQDDQSQEAEQALIDSIHGLPATAASAQGDFLSQIHSHNQHYALVSTPQLVLPDVDRAEYPSLARHEGKIMPKPVIEASQEIRAEDTKADIPPANVTEKVSNTRSGKSTKTIPSVALVQQTSNSPSPAEVDSDAADSGRFNIQYHHKSRLANQIKETRRLYTQGKADQAIAQLQMLMSAHGKDWSLNKALLHMLLKERRWQDGEVLINKLQKPERKRLAQAQLLQAMGKLDEALFTLQRETPLIDDMPEYHQAMATLAQRLEDFPVAEKIYKKLLLIDNDNGAYWLGLASAQDAMGSAKAVNSYWRARQFNIEHRAVLKYINLRIKALSKASSAEELASRQGAAL
ncbi:tetratricopeptide repeat protein [Pseudoteredinibacter isoporae]|uniref:Flp pilus assembly protein TadD n=1 Tax=Pseudoteredinibacter isoporae TaxID=570281 RepID=A0A7X0JV39_9GAMM|nr:hypothetical protein [Pseudoteredinibacter isoporae]MBB6522359.1 Flp pilus assembly protein TadD [Pseudoteredinibacter isoporae]NHO87892.1 hypothetical protein [Pseudoteredinibacter isoporae]NIB23777.1 hypothetical protein [Pseudoteredinibacter isoporae]